MLRRYFLFFTMLMLIVSCDNKLNNSISLADSNKEALESVLEHFEHDSNPLKYEAAKFLIENMPFHQSTTGETAEKYAEACDVWNVQKFNKSIKLLYELSVSKKVCFMFCNKSFIICYTT